MGSMYFSENFYKANDGPSYTDYPTSDFDSANAYTGDPDTVYDNPGGGWIAWENRAAPLPAIVADSMAYTGLVNVGSKKLVFYSRSGGTYYQLMERTFNAFYNDGQLSYFIAMMTACYNNKNAVTVKFNGITTSSDGTTPATFLNFSAESPSIVSAGGTTLYTGDSSFTPHLIIVQVDCDGTYTNPVTMKYYVDPNLSVAPASWGSPAKTITTLYLRNAGVSAMNLDSGRSSSTIDSRNYFDAIRVSDDWWSAVGMTSDPTIPTGNTSNFFHFARP